MVKSDEQDTALVSQTQSVEFLLAQRDFHHVFIKVNVKTPI